MSSTNPKENDGAGHPTRHGYVKCSKCDCWRRLEGVEAGVCKDRAFCNAAAIVCLTCGERGHHHSHIDWMAEPKP